ncbi:MAG: TolC family protein, partial [Pigmentiphaga sp.]
MRTSSTVLPTLSVSPRRARPSMPLRGLLAAGLALLLSACAVGPDYHRPDISLGQTFKHEEGWKLAAPQDDLPRGAWWANYQDPVLNQLMEQIEASNLTLEQSRAQIRQAQASLGSTRSAGFPSLDASSSATRSSNNNSNNTGTSSRSSTATQYSLSLGVSWELDLWGRVARGVEAAEASMQASMANLATTRLGLQAALARNYFQLRVMDEEKRLLEETIKL